MAKISWPTHERENLKIWSVFKISKKKFITLKNQRIIAVNPPQNLLTVNALSPSVFIIIIETFLEVLFRECLSL